VPTSPSPAPAPRLVLSPEVGDALSSGRPVVALESTLLAHGLPRPANRAAADDVEAAVRAGGAVPATIAVLAGVPHVGLTAGQVDRVCADPDLAKLGVRDLPVAAALGRSGATTVASTALLAAAAGIGVFATGGLGGVHRHSVDTFDESADLTALSRTSLVVVCAGVKSILDVPATLERLESLSVTVVGYRTTTFPGFYVTDSGSRVDWSVADPAEAAAVFAARRTLAPGAVIVANPLPAGEQLDPELHDRVITGALAAAEGAGVRGKDVTPFVLDHLHRASEGATLAVNVRLVLRNAELAGRIAAALVPALAEGPR
jgi:pseudouridylate synthase